jgi:hypothetical protein
VSTCLGEDPSQTEFDEEKHSIEAAIGSKLNCRSETSCSGGDNNIQVSMKARYKAGVKNLLSVIASADCGAVKNREQLVLGKILENKQAAAKAPAAVAAENNTSDKAVKSTVVVKTPGGTTRPSEKPESMELTTKTSIDMHNLKQASTSSLKSSIPALWDELTEIRNIHYTPQMYGDPQTIQKRRNIFQTRSSDLEAVVNELASRISNTSVGEAQLNPGLVIINELPEDKISEFNKDAGKAEAMCKESELFAKFHDCNCVGQQVLNLRILKGPNANGNSTESLFEPASKHCVAKKGVYDFYYQNCYSATSNTLKKPEEFCTCVANDATGRYVKLPYSTHDYIYNQLVEANKACHRSSQPEL